jgi:hypothetical protein
VDIGAHGVERGRRSPAKGKKFPSQVELDRRPWLVIGFRMKRQGYGVRWRRGRRWLEKFPPRFGSPDANTGYMKG